jgi:dipeptidyl aminopeptidase/acylaminoacyl peptidase
MHARPIIIAEVFVSFLESFMRHPALAVPFSLLLLFLTGCSSSEPPVNPAEDADTSGTTAISAAEATLRYTIEQFMDTEQIRGAGFSSDGGRIAYSSNRSGVFNVYAQPVEGGEPEPLTDSSSDPRFFSAWFPNDDRLIFTGDQGGNELTHVYVRNTDGSVVDLTPGEGLRAGFVGFSADGSVFWVTSNERDSSVSDVYEYDAETLERTLLVENTVDAFPSVASPDGRYVAFSKVHVRSDMDILLWDRERAEFETLVADEEAVVNSAQAFSADGGSLFYTTDRGSEFRYLVELDLESREERIVLQPEWDVSFASRSRGGNFLVAGINQDSRTALTVLSTEDFAEVELPELPDGNVASVTFSNDDAQMAFYLQSSRRPRDLFIVATEGNETPRPLTSSLNSEIDPDQLVDGEVVRFTSYDGMEIPGVMYRPHGASAETPVPMLVRVHGGPGGQARVGYSALNQYLINHGYAIFDINNRGSSGYGKTFYAADDRCHGECDLDDVVAARDWLADMDWVDADRIGIMGGSYGGYMTAAALAFRPEVFEVGVNIFGVTNWLRTLESIPAWWGPQREALYSELGNPAEDAERLRRISPLFHAENIVRPMIVLQGANDPRVLQVESDEIVEAVRANGVPVEYVLFDDEGHGFRNRDNEIEGYRAIREFLDRYLVGQGA